MPNPFGTVAFTVKGVWLIPYVSEIVQAASTSQVWINAQEIQMRMTASNVTRELPSRYGRMVDLGRHHGHVGGVRGQIIEGFGQNGYVWARRLQLLIANQREYWGIALVSRDVLLRRVLLDDGYEIGPQVTPQRPRYEVSIPFTEIIT